MVGLPTGTVTFLFTDLEGSTRLWEQHPDAMRAALARHDELMTRAIEDHHGHVIKTTGDGFFAAFASASDGVEAAIDAQLALAREDWPETGELRVRMGLHTGAAELRDGDYHGPTLNRAARLMSVGHGGQVLVSLITSELVRGADIELVDLGTHHLRDLAEPEQIFQVAHPGLRAEFGALRTAARPAPPSNVPVALDRLIGRTRELQEVRDRLREARLLTLLGTGGIGKTRLAMEVARGLCDEYDDRVYVVDLSGCTDLDAVLAVATRTIGVQEGTDGSLLDGIKERIGEDPMLLVLDNFEQVTTAGAAVVELLRDCPGLTALVTSREALNVSGEQVYPVPPLALPAERGEVSVDEAVASDAVQLFVDRARAVRADFELTAENAPAVVELCERLDGLPLAIELATARLALFSPEALVERLGSRLDLLTGGARDAPERQRALRDTIGWSYDLLTADEQRLLALLAVFSGATITAVEQVAARAEGLASVDVLDGLGSLVAKSLVRRSEGAAGAEPRVSMLETIRAFAAERLGDDTELRRRVERAHAEYFAEWAASRREPLSGDGRDAAAAVMAEDAENLSSAWRFWVGQADFEQLDRLIDGLWPLYELRGWYFSTAALIEDLLGVLSSSPFTKERLLQQIRLQTSLARVLMASQGYTPETERAHQRALQLCEELGEVPQLVPVLRVLSSFYIYLSDFEQARRIGEQLLSLAERFDDNRARVEGHLLIGVNEGMLARLQVGIEHLEQGIEAYGAGPVDADRFQTGNDPGVVIQVVAGMLLWMAGFPDQARDRADDAVRLAEHLRHPPSSAYAHFHTGLIRMWRNEPVSALEHARAVVEISDAHELPVWRAVGSCLRGAAVAATGEPDEGLVLFEAAVEQYRALKTPPVFWAPLLQLHAAVCALAGRPAEGLALVDEALDVIAQDAGPQMSASELLTLKGQLLLATADEAEAEECFRRAVASADAMNAPMFQLRATLALARLWAQQGKREEARTALQEAHARLTEGFTTLDLVDAARLLDDLAAGR